MCGGDQPNKPLETIIATGGRGRRGRSSLGFGDFFISVDLCLKLERKEKEEID